ncbi:MAG TPA: site-specific integrase [Brevibacterium sp.]|nr:site-specific integrase [Brevibacterium sp.]
MDRQQADPTRLDEVVLPGHIHGHLIPAIGHVALKDLSPGLIEKALSGLRQEEGGLSAGTVRRIHATLLSALNSAVRRGLVESNPAEQVELPVPGKAELNTWTAGHARQFLQHVRGDRWSVLYRLLLVTGMRRGEVLSLRWSDLDLARAVVVIRRQLVLVGTDMVEGPPKSSSGRRAVVLDDQTRLDLIFHSLSEAAQRDVGPDDLVFHVEGQPLHPGFVSRHFLKLSRQAGLPRIRLHDLRHTSASLGLAAGESLVEVSRRLGHSSIGITADVYTHVDTDLARNSAQRRAALFTDTDESARAAVGTAFVARADSLRTEESS